MEVFALAETGLDIGCYGVFSNVEKATEYALALIREQECSEVDETLWDGFVKRIYYGSEPLKDWDFVEKRGCFEITRHILDAG